MTDVTTHPPIGAAPTELPPPDLRHRPAAELVKDLSAQVSTLMRQELELAKVELSAKGKQAGVGAGMLGGAGLMALYGVGALVVAAIAALAITLPVWASALIVAGGLFLLAAMLAIPGAISARKAIPPMPEQTDETVKEDVRFTKESVQEARQ
jgi:hypothetical protein